MADYKANVNVSKLYGFVRVDSMDLMQKCAFNEFSCTVKKLHQELTMSLPDSEDTEEDDEDDEECGWRLDRDTGESALRGDEESLCCSSLEVCSKSSTPFWTKMTRNIVKIHLAFILKAQTHKYFEIPITYF